MCCHLVAVNIIREGLYSIMVSKKKRGKTQNDGNIRFSPVMIFLL